MYEKIQFVSYELYTGPRFLNQARKEYPGKLSEFDDVAWRLGWIGQIADAVQRALPGRGKASDGTILRLCMMPEFLMRGADGAYDLGTIDIAIGRLQELVGEARFADWIFVFGTLIGRSHPTRTSALSGKQVIDWSAGIEAYNICPVIRGGWNADGSADAQARTAATTIVMKQYLSVAGVPDFITTTENDLTWARVAYLPPAQRGGRGRERQRRNDDGAALFTIGGVTFGLEICLDHLAGRLKDSPPLPGDPLVQVQLVPSCGASIKPASVVAVAGGLVCNVDGFLSRHSVVKPVAQAATLAAPVATLGADAALRTIDLPVVPADFGTFYADGPGRICVFEPIDLPPAATA